MFKNKTILITGGTGSFGTAFINELVKKYPEIKKIVIFITVFINSKKLI